jgi:hypothetical protein
MTALTADRKTPKRDGEHFNFDVAAATEIFAGALVVLDSSGNCEPGTTATGKIAAGRAKEHVNNTGAAGALQVEVDSGCFQFENSAGADEITKAEIGDVCYIVDDQTVAKTDGTGTRSRAGYIRDVDADGVFVDVAPPTALVAGLTAANNLSDVGSAATSRANIGANKVQLGVRCTNVVGADATLYGIPVEVAGTVESMRSVLGGAALAGGDATLTSRIDGTPITDGAITIAQSGSAIGDKDSASPSAANTVAAGDTLEVLVGGTNTDTDAFADVSFLIET